MKRLLIFFLLLFSLARGEAQTYTADRVVTKSLYLRDWWVDSVKRDTNFLGAVRSIPTAAAVYNFVAGRGAPGYTSVTSLPDSSGLVFHGPNGVQDTVVFEGETGSGGVTQATLDDSTSVLRDSINALRADIASGGGGASTVSEQVYYLSKEGILSDADLSFGSTTFGTDQTAAIQAILDNATATNPIIIYWDVRASVTGLRIKSNTTIKALPNAGAILRNNSDNFLFYNYNWTGGNNAVLDSNITIDGGVWNGNGYQGATAMQVHSNSTKGMIAGFSFAGVKNLTLKNFTLQNTRTYAMLMMTQYNVLIDNITVDQGPDPQLNQDGIDAIGGMSSFTIKNSRIRCGDDRLAFSPNAAGGSFTYTVDGSPHTEHHEPYTGVNGDQTGIRIDNIYFWGPGKGLRFNGSANTLSDVYVSNIYGTAKGIVVIFENMANIGSYTVASGPGDFRNFTFENMEVDVVGTWGYDPADMYGNYVFGCNVDGLYLKNIRKKDYTVDFPTIAFVEVAGTVVMRNVVIENYFGYESSATNRTKPHIHVKSGVDIDNMRVVGADAVKETPSASASLVKIESGATVSRLSFAGVTTDGFGKILDNASGGINTLKAVQISHSNAAGGAAFTTTATIPAFVLSNWDGVTKSSGTFTSVTGDAYASYAVTPDAPTSGVVDDGANTFDWTNNPSYTATSDYEYTLDGGTTPADVTAKPLAVGDVNKSIGQVGVRVKAAAGRNASDWLFNTSAFTATVANTFEAQFTGTAGTSIASYTPEAGTISSYGGTPTLDGSGGLSMPAGSNIKTTSFDQSEFLHRLQWSSLGGGSSLYVILETAGSNNAYFEVDVSGGWADFRVLKNDVDVTSPYVARVTLASVSGLEMQRVGNNLTFRKRNSDSTTTDLHTMDVTGYTFTALKIVVVGATDVLDSVIIQ